MDWQVKVVNQPHAAQMDVYIYREVKQNQMEMITNLSGPAGIEAKSVDRGSRMVPAMTLDWHDDELLQAIVDGLHDHGIRATQEPIIKNELTAIKYHLEDMRTLIFKGKEVDDAGSRE